MELLIIFLLALFAACVILPWKEEVFKFKYYEAKQDGDRYTCEVQDAASCNDEHGSDCCD